MLQEEIVEVIRDDDPLLPDCIDLIIIFKDQYGKKNNFLTTLEPCPGQS